MMDPILHYETGHPTRLVRHPRLAEMLEALGDPVSIQRKGNRYHLEWLPIYPGVPIPSYDFRDPWPQDRRKLVSVTVKTQEQDA